MKQTSQWRTAGLVVLGFIVLLLAFRWSSIAGGGREKLFELLRDGIVVLVATGAGKSAIEHLAAGGGLRGAGRALLTDAKPGDPEAVPGGTP